ncbi:MAG: hypothetical protein H0W88_11865 [Parachlamydiaceae bacterium]|nr:hypothetical protein [Parachlamydiaceae bacterium]
MSKIDYAPLRGPLSVQINEEPGALGKQHLEELNSIKRKNRRCCTGIYIGISIVNLIASTILLNTYEMTPARLWTGITCGTVGIGTGGWRYYTHFLKPRCCK